MIVKMDKYTFVVLADRKEDFLERLQKLGMVDVTIAARELSEEERNLVMQIEHRCEAVEYLGEVAKVAVRSRADISNPDTVEVAGSDTDKVADLSFAAEPYTSGVEAFDEYTAAKQEIAVTESEIARYEKLAEEVRPWGDYDPEKLRELAAHDISIEFMLEQAEIIKTGGGSGGLGGGVAVGVPKIPNESPAQIEAHIAELKTDRKSWQKVLERAAATLPAIEADTEALKDRLQLRRTAKSGEQAAEGSLVVMEAWAREKQAFEVERMLEQYPDVLHIKERPTPEDETPVELKNSRFASPFEFIGDLYSKPKYGTMDLTRWFAPFFMLFFGMCLGDLGYGVLIFLGGLGLALKGKKESMRSIGRLTMWSGGAAAIVGFMMGGLFGTSLAGWSVFRPVQKMFITSDTMFYLSIAIGVFQVMFAMVLNVVMTWRAFGLKYALANIGWIVVLLTCLAAFGLQYAGVEGFASGGIFAPGSIPFWAAFGTGMVLMLFFNAPEKNVFVNFGGGLWALFNRITGLMGDALSYIRLFAIGLSGGVLAQVFNRIAFEMSPDVPVLGAVVTLVILLIGHSLNLFLSTLSSVVHPLRLTFVEFFNNAGFEATDRIFTPLKRNENENK